MMARLSRFSLWAMAAWSALVVLFYVGFRVGMEGWTLVSVLAGFGFVVLEVHLCRRFEKEIKEVSHGSGEA
jgi:hypothetical protein